MRARAREKRRRGDKREERKKEKSLNESHCGSFREEKRGTEVVNK